MKQLKLVRGKPVLQLIADNGEVLTEILDYTLHYLVSNGLPLTVEQYIRLNTMSDASSLNELGPQDRSDVEDLIELGLLSDVPNLEAGKVVEP